MADDLKRSGGFVPGIRPGIETSEYLDKIMSLITFPGSLFLALIAVFPAIAWSIYSEFNNRGQCFLEVHH